jgi:ATP-dependent DNA helicase RecQ
VRQFIEQDLVQQDLQFGGLRLGAKAQPVLDGEKVFVRRQPASGMVAVREGAPAEHDPGLFEQLRRKRRELADQAGVPAYIIFSDRALVEMATHLPRTPEQFLDINGVGEAKLAHYGDSFLKVIRDHCAARNLPPPAPPNAAEPEPMHWLTVRRRHEEIGDAFAAGATLDELASRFGIKRETVVQNLARYAESGGKLDAGRLLGHSRLATAERERVLGEFARLGLERLAPVREALGGVVPYEELHLLRLCALCRG